MEHIHRTTPMRQLDNNDLVSAISNHPLELLDSISISTVALTND